MTDLKLNRRGLLAATLALTAAPILAPGLARAASPVKISHTIKVGDRDVELTAMGPPTPTGIVVFSHGAGNSPAGYEALFEIWAKAGLLVVAPLHVDSLKHPKHADYTLQAAFPLRIADVAAAADWSRLAAHGLPVAAAGHSYGALTAAIRGGALESMVHARDPGIKAVVCFSSPGVIPGLIRPDAYGSVATPLLMVTGDKDLVPGMVADWHDHLRPFETSPASDKYAWIGKGVDHKFGGAFETGEGAQGPAFADAAATSAAFLRAQLLGDADAKAALSAKGQGDLAELRKR